MAAATPILEARGVTRRFPGVVANDDVSIAVMPGEVVGVLGENGAGKSTLMKILAGLETPDAGTVAVDGNAVRFHSARDATAAGIGMVHQHFMLVDDMTVLENVALGARTWGRWRVDFAAVRAALQAVVRELGLATDLDARIVDLSVAARQQVEILRCLVRRPRILILDEPTALLSGEERTALIRVVRVLASRGTAVLLISHKLEDVMEGCDRVVVMRRGRVVDAADVAGRSREALLRLVLGGDAPVVDRRPATPGPVVLEARGVSVHGAVGRRALHDVSFELRSGEIVALCGVEGNGQSELLAVLAGMLVPDAGEIVWRLPAGTSQGALDAERARPGGLVHIPEDRLRHGVVPRLSLVDNWLLTHLEGEAVSRFGVLRRDAARRAVVDAIERHDVRAAGPDVPLATLSGGNQQKFVVARELAHRPAIVLAGNPTRGLDARTVAAMERNAIAARDRGACVVWLTTDLADVWAVADRVMVMASGRLRGPVEVGAIDAETLGRWMTAH